MTMITEVKAPRGGADMNKTKSTRIYFDGTEDIYVMDAKGIGNIGRYFNVIALIKFTTLCHD